MRTTMSTDTQGGRQTSSGKQKSGGGQGDEMKTGSGSQSTRSWRKTQQQQSGGGGRKKDDKGKGKGKGKGREWAASHAVAKPDNNEFMTIGEVKELVFRCTRIVADATQSTEIFERYLAQQRKDLEDLE